VFDGTKIVQRLLSMLLLTSNLILMQSFSPLWVGMMLSSTFKKERKVVINENAINHPLLGYDQLVLAEKQIQYQAEDFI